MALTVGICQATPGPLVRRPDVGSPNNGEYASGTRLNPKGMVHLLPLA